MKSKISLNPFLAVRLDPMFEQEQVNAMSNGDCFVTNPSSFETYQTKISNGCDKAHVTTDVLGIKYATENACLLKEFLT